jgi:phosphotransferase system IIB component
MKTILAILAIVATTNAVQLTPLDSLLNRSRETASARGFLIQGVHSNIKSMDTDTTRTLLRPLFTPMQLVNSNCVSYRDYYTDREKTSNELTDLKVSVAKMTTILENQQTKSDANTAVLTTVTKLIEAIIGLLTAVAALIVVLIKIKK